MASALRAALLDNVLFCLITAHLCLITAHREREETRLVEGGGAPAARLRRPVDLGRAPA